jgi:YD repeat-containing protein
LSNSYFPFYLKKIQRFNAANQRVYEVECLEYDMHGNVLKRRSPASIVSYTYDLLDRKIAIQSPHWESYLEQFDAAGNLMSQPGF